MTDPFESSHRKIKRALEHFSNFTREVKEFVGSNPYEKVVEPDPKRPDHLTHKIKLTKPFPMRLGDIAADVVENLRNALDNAGYAIAISAGCPTRNTAFPFAGSLTDLMKHSLGRSKDLPAQIQSLFCGFQPYLGGDDLLWALNEILHH